VFRSLCFLLSRTQTKPQDGTADKSIQPVALRATN
jgi:hypothetical protein